jgi:hypothetical protein
MIRPFVMVIDDEKIPLAWNYWYEFGVYYRSTVPVRYVKISETQTVEVIGQVVIEFWCKNLGAWRPYSELLKAA